MVFNKKLFVNSESNVKQQSIESFKGAGCFVYIFSCHRK